MHGTITTLDRRDVDAVVSVDDTGRDVLVDSCVSHNFVSQRMVEELKLEHGDGRRKKGCSTLLVNMGESRSRSSICLS